MSGHPVPMNFVVTCCLIERQPQILVPDFLFPTAGLPSMYPLGNAFAHILGISKHLDLACFPQLPERLDCCLQLHSVVRRCDLGTCELPNCASELEDCCPSAGTRVSEARAV